MRMGKGFVIFTGIYLALLRYREGAVAVSGGRRIAKVILQWNLKKLSKRHSEADRAKEIVSLWQNQRLILKDRFEAEFLI